jgi:predicted nuclease of predicted toxin-antitoxin system
VRILIDQNLTEYMRDLLPGHDVVHSSEAGWSELANGDLLTAAEAAGFDAMLTADKNILHQNRLTGRWIGLIVLSTNRWPTIQQFPERVLTALENLTPGAYVEVEFPRPPLRRRPPPNRPEPQ